MPKGKPTKFIKKYKEEIEYKKAQESAVKMREKLEKKYGIKVDKLCNGGLCCQAITKSGHQCTRKALFPELMYDIESKDALLCAQHLAMFEIGKHITKGRIEKAIIHMLSLCIEDGTIRDCVKLSTRLDAGLLP